MKTETTQKNTKKGTFTTAQAIAKAVELAAKECKSGEDVRKVYPAEGTGCGGRWVDLLICCELDNAETGEHIRDIYILTFKKYDSARKVYKLVAVLW